MKSSFSHLSKYRVRVGSMGSDDSIGRHGAFEIPYKLSTIQTIATCGIEITSKGATVDTGWEHVSAKARTKGALHWRCPTWEEMCFIKNLFWDEDEIVIQYHIDSKDLVNIHPAVLHLWKPTIAYIPLPPKDFV